jgi:hypothetical protein
MDEDGVGIAYMYYNYKDWDHTAVNLVESRLR